MEKLNDFSGYIAMCTCTGVVHNFCNPHGLLLRLMSSDALVHTCKCLLNTLGRAVEQLAGCLAKETAIEVKVQHTQCRIRELVAYPLMNI